MVTENAGFSLTCGRTKVEVFEYDDVIHDILLAWRMLRKGCYRIYIALAFPCERGLNFSRTFLSWMFFQVHIKPAKSAVSPRSSSLGTLLEEERIYHVNTDVRYEYEISVAESQTFLLARRSQRRGAAVFTGFIVYRVSNGSFSRSFFVGFFSCWAADMVKREQKMVLWCQIRW